MANDWQELTKLVGEAQFEVDRVRLLDTGVTIEGPFKLPPLALLPAEDQVFVAAFVRASHLGGVVGGSITFRGVNYKTTAAWDDPNTDLKIYKVSGTFPSFAPLYTLSNETGKRGMVFGRGTGRGSAVVKNGATKGWKWAAQDQVMSWGENKVASVPSLSHRLRCSATVQASCWWGFRLSAA